MLKSKKPSAVGRNDLRCRGRRHCSSALKLRAYDSGRRIPLSCLVFLMYCKTFDEDQRCFGLIALDRLVRMEGFPRCAAAIGFRS